MGMKGDIEPDHILDNRSKLTVAGVFEFTPIETGELSDEIKAVDLPDDTRGTGGRKKATQLTFKVPAHHEKLVAALRSWFAEGVGIVSPGYKKVVTLTVESGTGERVLVRNLFGCWLSKQVVMATSMQGDGQMMTIEFTMEIDEVGLV